MAFFNFNKDAWYNNAFGDGVNIFGASRSNNIDLLKNAGLIGEKDIEDAQRKSLMQGLLGTGIAYLSQPKNQGYGSIFPYIGKAFQVGMQQANNPYDDLNKTADLALKLKPLNDEAKLKQAIKDVYVQSPDQVITDTRSVGATDRVLPDGTTAPAPNYETVTTSYTLPGKMGVDKDKLEALKYTNFDAYTKLKQADLLDAQIAKTYAEANKRDLSTYAKEYRDLEIASKTQNVPNKWATFADYVAFKESQKGSNTNVTLNTGASTLSKNLIDSVSSEKVLNRIQGAEKGLAKSNQLLEIVESDNFLGGGVGFEARQGMLRMAVNLGIKGKDEADTLAQTNVFMQDWAQAQLAQGEFLSGPPSEKEQDLLKRAAKGEFKDMTKEEIRQMITLNKQTQIKEIELYNRNVNNLIDLQNKIINSTSGYTEREKLEAEQMKYLLESKRVKMGVQIKSIKKKVN